MTLQIPTIDMSQGLDHPHVVQQLARACTDWGFFQLQGHGVNPELRQQLFAAMTAFFALPRPERLALSRTETNFWGYYDRELTKNRVDSKEIFDIDGNLDNLASPSQAVPWPASQPEMREVVEKWLGQCEALGQSLLAGICLALEESPATLNPFFYSGHTSFLRYNHYPATRINAGTDTLGIHPHTDAGALTVLAQDRVPGLQVRKGASWHTVIPATDSFIINIGDMLQVWSNDRFQAPEHRVLASGDKARLSAAYFYNPSYETICQPLVNDGQQAHYQPIRWGEFRFGRAAGDYANLGEEIQIAHYRV